MKRFYSIFMFFLLVWSYGQNSISGYEYWFDNNYFGKVTTIVVPALELTVNTNAATSSLENGIHAFNIRSWDSNGLFSSTLSSFFYKIPEQATFDRKIVAYEYWFDNDYANAVSQIANNQQTFTLNTNVIPSALASGIHTFNIRFRDNTGFSSSALSSFFYKIPEQATFDRKIVAYEYWFDSDYANAVSQTTDNQETFTLNTAITSGALANGIHTFSIRFRDNTGFSSSALSNFFYKNENENTILKNIVAYEYWFNDDYGKAVFITINPEQIANLDTFVIPESTGLGIGNHFMNIRFKDDSGMWSSISSDEFELTTLGLENITKLENVVLYPNPTTKMITVELATNYENAKLELYDMNGRLLKQQSFENKKTLEFELNDAVGIYLISIMAEGKKAIFRVIKK